ncbi:hypothetical protein B0H13DRAFT_2359401 [Mycena leptocephala]|nr:hypothetical protein B0H13DRAFT_2359401 [Mycena leptocephala]
MSANSILAGSSGLHGRFLSPAAVPPTRGPLPRYFPDVERPAFIPIPQFPTTTSVLPRTSSDPIEQDMLDSSFITGEDLDIQSGSLPPYLGDTIRDPLAFRELLDHQQQLNAAVSRAAVPLTARVAHSLPKPTPEEREIERTVSEIYSDVSMEDNVDAGAARRPSPSPSTTSEPEPWRYRMDPVESESDLDDLGFDSGSIPSVPSPEPSVEPPVAIIVSVDAEDTPDPFRPQNLDFDPTDISALPPHLLTIYCVVSWLHTQFHLPRSACDALLTIWVIFLTFIAPTLEPPMVTLKAVNSALGLSDVPIHVLAVVRGAERFSLGVHTRLLNVRNANPISLAKFPRQEDENRVSPSSAILICPFQNNSRPFLHFLESKILWMTGGLLNANPDYIRMSLMGEQTGDELQRFIRPIVSDLLRLYQDGIVIPTPSHPEGRLVRVVLLAVVCDKPAAHKIGGFGSHSHTCFCTMCWITLQDKKTPASFDANAFHRRTNEEQRRLGEEYRKLTNKTQRAKFVKLHATRYTQLSRLPYFNLVEQIVIDPMHNLLMGLTKTHFHTIWVQGNILCEKHELRVFHEMLANFSLPGVCGKLPKELGLTSGGSLTADQWLLLATVYGPIIIPQLWSACIPEEFDTHAANRVTQIARQEAALAKQKAAAAAAKEAKALEKAEIKKAEQDRKKAEREQKKLEKAAEKAEEDRRKREERAAKKLEKEKLMESTSGTKNKRRTKKSAPEHVDPATSTLGDSSITAVPWIRYSPSAGPTARRNSSGAPTPAAQPAEDTDSDLPFNLHPDDPENFLKLSAVLSILQQDVLSESDINRADALIREYCKELIPLYGSSSIKPNHHYATHTSECIRNFGPLREFWTFLFERLNKLLKSIKTNNHGNGELEMTFFSNSTKPVNFLEWWRYCLSGRDQDSLPGQVSQVLNKASNEDRGTVAELAALSRDLDKLHRDAKLAYEFSPHSKVGLMTDETYHQLAGALTKHFPDVRVHCISDPAPHPDSIPLNTQATFYNYVVVDGRRYYASSRARSNRSSLIQAAIPTGTGISLHCGELLEIFKFQQCADGTELWFGRVRWFTTYRGTPEPIWEKFACRNVALWEIEEYIPWSQLDPIIDLSNLRGHLGRSVVSLGLVRTKAWATILIKAIGNALEEDDE